MQFCIIIEQGNKRIVNINDDMNDLFRISQDQIENELKLIGLTLIALNMTN